MRLHGCFTLLTVWLFSDLSNGHPSCDKMVKCLEPLKARDAYTNFFLGPDLTNDHCNLGKTVLTCVGWHEPNCPDDAGIATELAIVRNVYNFMCDPSTERFATKSHCTDEAVAESIRENTLRCYSNSQEQIGNLVERQMYCKACSLLKACVQDGFKACSADFSSFYDAIFPDISLDFDCYDALLVSEFIVNKMKNAGMSGK